MEPMNYRIRKDGRRRGTLAVEMAFTLPLLLLTVMGAIEYGWLLLNLQQMNNAVRHGARTACVDAATGAEGETAIDNLLAGTIVGQAASYRYDVDDGNDPNMVVATVDVNSVDIAIVKVTGMFPLPATLHVEMRMKKEGLGGGS